MSSMKTLVPMALYHVPLYQLKSLLSAGFGFFSSNASYTKIYSPYLLLKKENPGQVVLSQLQLLAAFCDEK